MPTNLEKQINFQKHKIYQTKSRRNRKPKETNNKEIESVTKTNDTTEKYRSIFLINIDTKILNKIISTLNSTVH